VYESYDRRAHELFERGRRERDARMLDEVSRFFPVAQVVPDALLALGETHQRAGRLGPAAQSYKRLLSLTSPSDEARAQALWRLAHVYESQNFLVLARDTLLQLVARYPRATPGETGRDTPFSELVSAELCRPPLSQISADRPRPALPLPLVRSWHVQTAKSRTARVFTAAGMPPGITSSRVFLAEKNDLSPLDLATGEAGWKTDMAAPAVWVGYLSDKLVAATAQRVVALDLGTGTELWRFAQGGPARPRRGPDPFARAEAAAASPEGSRALLHDFQLVGGRLFCLRGDEEILALDGDTGSIDWSFSPRGSPINPKLWIGPERVVLQIQKPNQLLVLETDSGRQIGRSPLAEGESLERAPVPIDEDHVLLVTDRRTVKKFDMAHGQFSWDYRESLEMPVNGPPRVIVDAERVLVLHDGKNLIRLDPVNGSKRWSTVLGIEDLSERPDAILCDLRRVYCVSRESLRAISLDDGGALWSCHLSGPENALWSIALAERCVVAFPSATSPTEEEMESMPVVVRRQDSGALLQRFVFPATISEVSLRLDTRGALIATSRALWALARPVAGSLPEPAPLP
jgi:outer membrane protein assembly factor BamB